MQWIPGLALWTREHGGEGRHGPYSCRGDCAAAINSYAVRMR